MTQATDRDDTSALARPLPAAILVCCAALVAYAFSPFSDLIWDDQLLVRQQLAAFRTLADVFAPPSGIQLWSYYYYRPLVVLSYVLDQILFGRGASQGPHIANMAYHAFATLGVWALARRLLRTPAGGESGALVAGLLFAVHPIHAESVSWIAGRSDVLATMFLMPSLLALLGWRDRGSVSALLLAFALALLAMMAKETALTVLLLGPLLFARAPSPAGAAPGRAARLIGWAGLALAYVGAAVLYGSMRVGGGSEVLGVASGAPAEMALRLLRAAGYYSLKLLVPWPQLHYVPWSAVPGVVPSMGAVLALLAVAAGLLRWLHPAQRSAYMTAWAWVAITLAPAFAVVATGVATTPVAERYLYLPSAGLALWAGLLFSRAREDRGARRVSFFLAAAVLVLCLVTTLARGRVWMTDLRLWGDAAAKLPDHAAPLIEVGKARLLQGERTAAAEAFERALEVADTDRLRATAGYNLGTMALAQGRVAEAGRRFESARRTDPSYSQARSGLARALYEQGITAGRRGRVQEAGALLARAEEQQREALRLDPYQSRQQVGLSVVLAGRGELQLAGGAGEAAGVSLREASQALQAALALEPALAADPEVQQLARRVEDLLRRAGTPGAEPGAGR